MFQTFDDTADPASAGGRVAALRQLFDDLGVDAVLVPRADEHQGEYVPAAAERLRWLTGFTGSAGSVLVMRNRAVIFVDGRYTLQVRDQTDETVFAYENLVERPPQKWLKAKGPENLRLGIDPWLHTVGEAKALRKALAARDGALVLLDDNPVDAVWNGQPSKPLGSVEIHDASLAGLPAREKLGRLAEATEKAGAGITVLTDPASIAWAFNIRGSDVPHTPLALAFAVIAANGAHRLFIDKRKLPMETEAYLTQLCDLAPPSALEPELAAIAETGANVGLDFSLAAEKLRQIVEDSRGKVIAMADPARLPRAMKNDAEIAGTRSAHLRDGAAMVRFLCWLDSRPAGTVDEITAAKRLEELRRTAGKEAQMPLRDISFDTISGAGPNGAIIHYRVNETTNRMLEPGSLYLVDSGAQFADGTTDITRTVPIGEPADDMRRHYTIVMKGLIDISLLRFPPGTRGMDIDAIARVAHWKAGLDYQHGTGHGVGSFLSVHEGPQRIAKTGTEELKTGMFLSNEPGYYRAGEYGIRLENLIVVEAPAPIDGGEIDMHGFETLTRAPFDRRLIDATMLANEQLDWLNAYHRQVESDIGPLLDGPTVKWLAAACTPISR